MKKNIETNGRIKNMVTIFLAASYVHLSKDVCQIPYHMHKIYGFNSTVWFNGRDEIKDYSDTTPGLNFKNLINKYVNNKNIILYYYLCRYSKKIDILNLYHDTYKTKFITIIYKYINKRGFVYVKMDADEKYLTQHEKNSNSGSIFKRFIRRLLQIKFEKQVDLISLETVLSTNIYKKYHENISQKVITVPNGIDTVSYDRMEITSVKKQNIVLTVGRIGAPEKNHKLLIEALKNVKNLKDWDINLVGPIDVEFKEWFDSQIDSDPFLQSRIRLIGEVKSRSDLKNIYEKARIFVLTSDKEGYPLVIPEALYFGNFIISTDVGGVHEAINEGQFGQIVPIGDANALTNALSEAIDNPVLLDLCARDSRAYTRDNLYWGELISSINQAYIARSS